MRIVSLAPSHTEILFALGLGEQVAGVTGHCDYPAEVGGKERIGLFARPEVDKIVSLRPDLVISCGKLHQDYAAELRGAGLKVWDFFPSTVEELLGGMETLVNLTGAGEQGLSAVDSLRKGIYQIKEKTKSFLRPKVFFLMFDRPATTPGPASFQYDALSLAGASLLPAEKDLSFKFVSWEMLTEFDPEIIISCGRPPGQAKQKRCLGCRVENPPCWRDVRSLLENPHLVVTRAVINKRVYPVPCHWLCRPGPRLIEGIEKLSGLFHAPPARCAYPMSESVKVALIHAAVKWKDKEDNLRRLLILNEEAAAAGARIIVNPELATTGYAFESRRDISPFVEAVPGPTTELFGTLARRYGVYICLGLPEVDGSSGIYYNTAVFIGPDGWVMGRHRKLAPAFKENLWAARGNLPVLVAETLFGKVGVLICADAYWYKAARMAALKGARALLIPANWPPHHHPPQVFWQARALENGVYVLACNRTGEEQMMNCKAGQSLIIAPDGNILAQLQSPDDAVLYGTLPLTDGKFVSAAVERRLGERRPEFYTGIALDTFSQFQPGEMLGLPAGKEFTAATVQFVPSAGEPAKNTQRILFLLDRAADLATQRGLKLDLAVFPELVMSGAVTERAQAEKCAVSIPGSITEAVARKAKELALYVVMGLAEKEARELFNTAVLIGPEGLAGKYRKMHPAPLDKKWALPGAEGFCFFDLPFARAGLLLGHDLFFPESLETLAKQGVDVLCVPALEDDEKSWIIWEARIAEQMHLVVANQGGRSRNGSSSGPGGSLIYSYSLDPEKRIRMLSPAAEEKINIMLLNPRETRQKKFLEQVDYDLLLNEREG